mgnify:CR=1 FL=1
MQHNVMTFKMTFYDYSSQLSIKLSELTFYKVQDAV